MKIRQGGEKIKLGRMDGQDTPHVDLRFMGCICIFAREKNHWIAARNPAAMTQAGRHGGRPLQHRAAMTTTTKGKNNV